MAVYKLKIEEKLCKQWGKTQIINYSKVKINQ